jgi:protein required for attachment to host cells
MDMSIPSQALILVADGRKLLLLRNDGDEMYPNLHVETHREQDNPPDRMHSSDAPGRGSSGVGSRTGAMAETNFHQLEEDRFAALAADMLRKRALKNDFEQLIIAAPPRTLGELRKHYHKSVEQRLIREIDKDLTGMPVEAIERALAN